MCASGLHTHTCAQARRPPEPSPCPSPSRIHSVAGDYTQIVFFAMSAAREPCEWGQAKAFLLWALKINN